MSNYPVKRAKELAGNNEPWIKYLEMAMWECELYYGHPWPDFDPDELIEQQRLENRIERLEQTFTIDYEQVIQ